MSENNRTVNKRRKQRIMMGLVAAISSVVIVGPLVWGLVEAFGAHRAVTSEPATTTSSAPPVYTIKPLAVRPVVSAYVTTPAECPPPTPVAPDQPMRVCDIEKTAVYDLKPEALRLQLTRASTFLNPVTGAQTVEMVMTQDSATQFSAFTAAQVGNAIAFVRDGTVVRGPRISARIDSDTLQFSDGLTPELADQIVEMLKNGS